MEPRLAGGAEWRPGLNLGAAAGRAWFSRGRSPAPGGPDGGTGGLQPAAAPASPGGGETAGRAARGPTPW
jgi:hypothetical protein